MALPRKEGEANVICQNIAAKLGEYRATLGLSAGDVTRAANNAAVFQYLINVAAQFETAKNQFYKYKDELIDGEANVPAPVAPSYVLPELPDAVIVSSGIRKWTNNLIERIRRADNYTEDIGRDLGIAGDSKGSGRGGERGADIEETLKPTLKGRALADDTVELSFNKQGQAAIRYQMRRGASQDWSAARDAFQSPVIDHTGSAGGNPERREYRGIYLKNNEPYALWSDIITVYTTP